MWSSHILGSKFLYATWGEYFTCDSQRKMITVTGAPRAHE